MLAHGVVIMRDQVRQYQHQDDDGDVDIYPEPVHHREVRHQWTWMNGCASSQVVRHRQQSLPAEGSVSALARRP